MTPVVKALFAILVVCLLPSMVFAAPTVYPVREGFGFQSSTLPSKAPVFSKWIKTHGKNPKDIGYALGNEFNAAFRKEFGPQGADNVTDVNKHEVLVASLHLIRASQYVVPKMGNYEVHMPITMSIVITNPSTGEAIYSFTKTSYATVLLAHPDVDEQSEQLLFEKTASNYDFLLNTLIKEAKNEYNPEKIELSVAKVWNGLFIMDKGSKSGIARDDNLVDASGTEITVKYVTEDYSIAASLLGSVSSGQKFFKYATASTANQFSKPRVLTMHEGWKNPDLKSVSYLFDSEVSKESAFTLLPVNEYFRRLLEAVARDTYAGKFETTNQRAMPDYVMKFSATEPRHYTMSERGKFGMHVYEQYILGELLDKQGRIIFSAVGHNKIEDQNVGGMVFGKEARLEVVQKNAVVNLAEQFAKSIKFSHFVHPVTKINGKTIELEDKSRELRIGQEVTLYRNIGSVDGISSEIVIPIWQANVVEAEQGKVKLNLILPMAGKNIGISGSDTVIIDAISASDEAGQSETSVTYCSQTPSKLGSLEIKDFSVISRVAGYRLPYTLYDNDQAFSEMFNNALVNGGFKDKLKLGKVNTAGRCLLPVQKATVEKNQCEAGLCSYELSLAAGYRLYAGQEVKGKAGGKTAIKTEECPQNSQPDVIQGDLSKNVITILNNNINKLQYK